MAALKPHLQIRVQFESDAHQLLVPGIVLVHYVHVAHQRVVDHRLQLLFELFIHPHHRSNLLLL